MGAEPGAMLDEFKAAVLPGWYGELSIEYFETALSQPRRELLERPFRPRKSFRETRRYCERGVRHEGDKHK